MQPGLESDPMDSDETTSPWRFGVGFLLSLLDFFAGTDFLEKILPKHSPGRHGGFLNC